MFKKNDKVMVLSGKDKGKSGKVLKVLARENKILISQVNLVKRHLRTTQSQAGGIVAKESPIYISKVMLVCPKCEQSTRTRTDFLADGKKVRVCKKCGEIIL